MRKEMCSAGGAVQMKQYGSEGVVVGFSWVEWGYLAELK